MKEVFTMWRHTNMIVLVALSAAIYAALLIPFQSIPIIPGHVSLRIANVLPIALGLLFGPAGAWGAAIGNLIGDLFGTLSLGSIGGFVSNFMIGFLGYKLWNGLSPLKDMSANINSGARILRYEVMVVIQATATTLMLTWWVCLLLGLSPAEVFFLAVILSSAIPKLLLTPILVRILYPRIHKWGLLWNDIMPPEEVSSGRFRKLGVALVSIGGIGGSIALSVLMYGMHMPSTDPLVRFLPVPFIILIFVGAAMLGGRESVIALSQEVSERRKSRSSRPDGSAAASS